MKGKHIINIVSRKARYILELERKISVIKGNSGTGKTTLIRLVSEYLEYGKKSGVKLSVDSSASLGVLTNSSEWEKILPSAHDTVFFIDEDVAYLYSETFQRELKDADCYAVVVSRSGMFAALPYSVFAIYELITERKGYGSATSMYRLYHENHKEGDCDIVLTEDTNSGYEMAKYAFQSNETEVKPAGGNSSVLNKIEGIGQQFKHMCVIVDGAAFGPFIEPVLKYNEVKGNISVSAPESFEFAVLSFNELKRYLDSDYGEISRTYDFCDGKEFTTWEQYYEYLLKQVTSEHLGFTYTKRKLNPWFLNRNCAEQFMDIVFRSFVMRRG